MTHFQEKAVLGVASIASSSVSALGAIMVGDDVLRYLYVTLTVSILTASFMALVFRRAHEGISVVVGRCGLSILGGVFGTRVLMTHFHIEAADRDIVYLMGLSGAVTIASFLVGVVILQLINKRATTIAERILARWGLGEPPRK